MTREKMKRVLRKAVREFIKNPSLETLANIPHKTMECSPGYSEALCLNTQHAVEGYVHKECTGCPLGEYREDNSLCMRLCGSDLGHLEQYWERHGGETLLALIRFSTGFTRKRTPVPKHTIL